MSHFHMHSDNDQDRMDERELARQDREDLRAEIAAGEERELSKREKAEAMAEFRRGFPMAAVLNDALDIIEGKKETAACPTYRDGEIARIPDSTGVEHAFRIRLDPQDGRGYVGVKVEPIEGGYMPIITYVPDEPDEIFDAVQDLAQRLMPPVRSAEWKAGYARAIEDAQQAIEDLMRTKHAYPSGDYVGKMAAYWACNDCGEAVGALGAQ